MGFHVHKHSSTAARTGVPDNRSSSKAQAVFATSQDAEKDAKKHQRRQHLAQTCAVASAAFALHEKRAAKKHPGDDEQHKKKEHVALAVAAGTAVLASHEKHEKKQALKQAKHLRRHGF